MKKSNLHPLNPWEDERLAEDVLKQSAEEADWAFPSQMNQWLNQEHRPGSLLNPGQSIIKPLASCVPFESFQDFLLRKKSYKTSTMTGKKSLSSWISFVFEHGFYTYQVSAQARMLRFKWARLTSRVSFKKSKETHIHIDAAWSYYAGLYQDKGPSVLDFETLLMHHGIPDFINPYGEDELIHYQVHPLGLLVTDVAFLLDGIEEAWNQQMSEDQVDPSSENFLSSSFSEMSVSVLEEQDVEGQDVGHQDFQTSSITQSIKEKTKQLGDMYETHAREYRPKYRQGLMLHEIEYKKKEYDKNKHHVWRHDARLTWAMTLIWSFMYPSEYDQRNHLTWMKSQIHPDNLWLLSADVYRRLPESWTTAYRVWTKEEYLNALKHLGWSPEVMESYLPPLSP